jgi:abortive infection bacteriophage resistance protein
MRTPAGFLLPMKKVPFQKLPLSIESQLDLLASRRLVIQDRLQATHHLTFISYYRFCGYGIEFEDDFTNSEKQYRAGTTFEQILDCYIFDRKLRLLVIDAIERIEVGIRTVMINTLSLKYGAHWYMKKEIFLEQFNHNELMKKIKKETAHQAPIGSHFHTKREKFLNHYFSKYSEPELPPIWMVGEILSVGAWSMMFSNLRTRKDQKIICEHFSIPYRVMESWLHALTYLRNLCAHHTKLWSRNFTLKPLIAKDYEEQLKNNASFAAQAAILKIFLNQISPGTNWGDRLQMLINEHPEINIEKMGFEPDWHHDVLWL